MKVTSSDGSKVQFRVKARRSASDPFHRLSRVTKAPSFAPQRADFCLIARSQRRKLESSRTRMPEGRVRRSAPPCYCNSASILVRPADHRMSLSLSSRTTSQQVGQLRYFLVIRMPAGQMQQQKGNKGG